MARWHHLITWGLLVLRLQLAIAHVAIPVRRYEIGTSTAAFAHSIRPESPQDAKATVSPPLLIGPTSVTTATSVPSSASASSPSSISLMSGEGNIFHNSSRFNITIPVGQLPLEPTITPGWAVTGVILICTGVIYTLIGIKNTVLHSAFSVAYVVGLSIAVLVVYAISVPVSSAAQGAYVVAAVLPAVFAGVLSACLFKDITECLACALGGVCFAMWLLCLRDGGLLSGVAKLVCIVVLSLVGFATYFTRWTRDWALVLTISFGGATATVLGIDCFSRAGLKEFWAYIWDLNDNLFPMGADTYPITKGIRVEIAAIIVIFCIGIISQKRLWNVINGRRAKRGEKLAEAQHVRDEEEASTGKELEARSTSERRVWRKGPEDYASNGSDHGSGFARDIESEQTVRYSQSTAISRSQAPPVVEMAGSDVLAMGPSKPTATDLMVSGKGNDGMVMVRVAPDDSITGYGAANRAAVERGAVQQGSTDVESVREVASAPEVVPLPFRLPNIDENMAEKRRDSLTIAKFADDDEYQADTCNKPKSFAERLFQSSTQLMRRASQRMSSSLRDGEGQTAGEFMFLRRPQDNSCVSIATTIDKQNKRSGGIDREPLRRSIEVSAQLAELADEQPADQKSERRLTNASRQRMSGEGTSNLVSAMTIMGDAAILPLAMDAVSPIIAEMPAEGVKRTVGGVTKDSSISKQREQTSRDSSLQSNVSLSQKAKSTASVDSAPANFTRMRLPPGFFNVALHCRTIKCAAHLSYAEAPEPDTLQLAGGRQQTWEAPAPVHVEDSQQTAIFATPATVPAKSPGPIQRPLSNFGPSRGHSRNKPYQSHRRGRIKTQFEPIAEEVVHVALKAVSTKSGSSEPISGVASSATSPQSLIAQRSVALHNKTYGTLTRVNTKPEILSAAYRASGESSSKHDYPVYPQQMPPASLDGFSTSQHKEIIRSAESVAFDSQQPTRFSKAPSPESRDARLASFRNSVRADISASMAASPAGSNGCGMTLGMYRSLSPTRLAGQNVTSEADLQRNINLQRSFLMSQKEAEAKRKEKERLDKERFDRAFTRSMQSGEMFKLHREAMRRMQNQARDA